MCQTLGVSKQEGSVGPWREAKAKKDICFLRQGLELFIGDLCLCHLFLLLFKETGRGYNFINKQVTLRKYPDSMSLIFHSNRNHADLASNLAAAWPKGKDH